MVFVVSRQFVATIVAAILAASLSAGAAERAVRRILVRTEDSPRAEEQFVASESEYVIRDGFLDLDTYVGDAAAD